MLYEKAQSFFEKCYTVFSVDTVGVIPPDGQLSPNSTIPPLARGKTPGRLGSSGWSGYGWRRYEPTRAEVTQWAKDGANLGIKAARWPGLDIDSSDPKIAERIQEMAFATLGIAPVRGRCNSAKRLLQYRTAEPFSRMRLHIKRSADAAGNAGETHLVEILGDKQYYVISGIHPSGVPYEWDNDPTAQPATEITREQVSQFLDAVAAEFAAQGYMTHRVGSGDVSAPAADQAELLAPRTGAARMDAIRDCVSRIPNTSALFPARDDCVRCACALKAAAGLECEDDARELFYDWCARWEDGDNNPPFAEDLWRSLYGPYQIGWSWLVGQAQPFGFNAATFEFEAIEGATPPAPDVGAEEDARWAATASEEERIAALHGNAERAFFLAPRDLTGEPLLQFWGRLEEAAQRRDPLRDLFRDVGMSAAHKFRSYASEPKTFEIFVDAECGPNASYSTLSANDARLLRRAAWSLVAPGSSFAGKGSALVGEPRQPGKFKKASSQWLLDGWLPRRGVGALIGESGSGKSHVIADLLSRIASGPPPNPLTGEDDEARRFAGREIHGNDTVLYFGSEAVEGWLERAERQIEHVTGRPAAEQAHGVFAVAGVPPLSSPMVAFTVVRDSIQHIRSEGKAVPSALIIDVLRAAVAGNENDSGDMDLALATAHMLARAFDVFVLLVHHTKKGDTTARGSGAIKANLDFEALVEKTGPADRPTYRLTVTKNKNGTEGATFAWHIPALDAPFVEGVASPTGLPEGATKISEQCAIAAGHAIRAIATGAHTVTKTELNEQLRSSRPDLFARDGKAIRSRLSRALKDALDAATIEEYRGKYRVGKTQPAPEAPDDLADLFSGGSVKGMTFTGHTLRLLT